MIIRCVLTALLLTQYIQTTFSQNTNLLTHYELGNYNVTPDYASTIKFCQLLAETSDKIHFTSIGKSARNLDIPLLIADIDGFRNPEDIRSKNRGILLILACNHPGEPDGKDAGLLLFRNICSGDPEALRYLEKFSIVFIPIFNVDGHERFGAYTRINQNGPEEAGWRTTAQNLNLNRDFLKAEAPEMQHFLKFYHHWDPDFSIDCHTTNGADYQYVVTYAIETGPQTDEGISAWTAEKYLPWIEKKMFDDNYPVFPYIGFRKWHDPREAILHKPSPAIISNGYFAATNRPGLLIETHMLKPYKQRVESTLAMIEHTLEFLNEQHIQLQNLIRQADNNMLNGTFMKQPFPVAVGLSKDSVIIDFLGVKFDVDTSSLSGAPWFRYDSGQPEIWKRPFFSTPEVQKSVQLPSSYIIPPEWGHLVAKLTHHGISYETTAAAQTFRIEKTTFEKIRFDNTPYEGCLRPSYEIRQTVTETDFPAGSFLIPVNQKGGRIVALLLEPESTGSFVAWGYFNTIFEQKEYSEMYVMEKIARKMLENDPSLFELLETEKRNHPDLYSNPWNVLNWFYQRSPWFDQQLNVYPVGRIIE